jgi:hypothetical protein
MKKDLTANEREIYKLIKEAEQDIQSKNKYHALQLIQRAKAKTEFFTSFWIKERIKQTEIKINCV